MLLIFFYCAPNYFIFLLAAQVLLKIKVSVEPCLVSVVVLMRGCSGTGEYEAGKEKKSQYTHYKKLDYTPLGAGEIIIILKVRYNSYLFIK